MKDLKLKMNCSLLEQEVKKTNDHLIKLRDEYRYCLGKQTSKATCLDAFDKDVAHYADCIDTKMKQRIFDFTKL